MHSDMHQEVYSNVAKASINIDGKVLTHSIIRPDGMSVERFIQSAPLIMSGWLKSMSIEGVGLNMWLRDNA